MPKMFPTVAHPPVRFSLLALLTLLLTTALASAQTTRPTQSWRGSLEPETGAPFDIVLTLSKIQSNTCDILIEALQRTPVRSPNAIPLFLSKKAVQCWPNPDGSLRVLLPFLGPVTFPPASADTCTARTEDFLGGKWHLNLHRTTTDTLLPRPQLDVPRAWDRELPLTVNRGEGIKLAGTLYLPKGPGPFPLLLAVQQRGLPDKTSITGGRQNYVLANTLASAGIASFFFDDRGSGASTGDKENASYQELTADTLAFADLLFTHPAIDPRRISLLGSNTNGVIAATAASQRNFERLILLSFPTIDGCTFFADFDVDHADALLLPKVQLTRELRDQYITLRKKLVPLACQSDATPSAIAESLMEQMPPSAFAAWDRQHLATLLSGTVTFIRNREARYRSFLGFDPRNVLAPVLAKNLPTLFVFASHDDATLYNKPDNIVAITRSSPAINCLTLPLTGELKNGDRGPTPFQLDPTQNISPQLLDLIVRWTNQQDFNAPEPQPTQSTRPATAPLAHRNTTWLGSAQPKDPKFGLRLLSQELRVAISLKNLDGSKCDLGLQALPMTDIYKAEPNPLQLFQYSCSYSSHPDGSLSLSLPFFGAITLPAQSPDNADSFITYSTPITAKDTLQRGWNLDLHPDSDADLTRTQAHRRPRGATWDREIPVQIDRPSGVHLAGTLFLPQGKGPFPLIICIPGGPMPSNRWWSIDGDRALASTFAQAGAATFYFDDRGVSDSTGLKSDATIQDSADDVVAIAQTLTKNSNIIPSRISFLGISEGTFIAPLAAMNYHPESVILLSAPTTDDEKLVARHYSIFVDNALAKDALLLPGRSDEFYHLVKAAINLAANTSYSRQSILEQVLKGVDISSGKNWDPKKLRAELEHVITYVRDQTPRSISYFSVHVDQNIHALQARAIPTLVIVGDCDTNRFCLEHDYLRSLCANSQTTRCVSLPIEHNLRSPFFSIFTNIPVHYQVLQELTNWISHSPPTTQPTTVPTSRPAEK